MLQIPSTKKIFGSFVLLLTFLSASLGTHAQDASENPENQAAAAAQKEPEVMVDAIVLVDENGPQVLALLEKLTGKSILRSQALPAVKINFNSQGKLSKSDAILALESLLGLNGIAITPLGDLFLKAEPSAGVTTQVPQFLEGSTLDLPPSIQYYTKLFRLKHLNVIDEAQPLIQPFASGNNVSSIVPMPKSNAILVTDSLNNLQQIERVLQRADSPVEIDEEIRFFSLKHTRAADLKARLAVLLQGQGNSGLSRFFQKNTVIEADERTNQIVVITHSSNIPLLEKLIDGLDVDVEPQSTSEVFSIKHAKAVDINTLLQQVIAGQREARQAESRRAAANMAASRELGAPPAPQGGEGGGAAPEATPSATRTVVEVTGMETLQFSEYVTTVADERSNSIVAYGTRSDLRQIGVLIEKLDKLLPQVAINVIIAEVILSEQHNTGFDELGLSYNLQPGAGFGFELNGPSFGAVGSIKNREFAALFSKARENSNFRVLSAPVIVTTHNREATVNVSESRPIITGTTTSTVNADTRTSQVQYRDIGIILTVTPLIGTNGAIQMEITQQVENLVDTTLIDNNEQPIIGKREATSFVSVNDGEVIVLAGLQESEDRYTKGRMFFFGDIPILGDLIQGRRQSQRRRELMIFIQPIVLNNSDQKNAYSEKAIDNLDRGDEVRLFLETGDMSTVDAYSDRIRAMNETNNTRETPPRRGPRH